MLVCSVSQLARRGSIAADLVEAGNALDAPGTGNVVFAALVDDPASVNDVVDGFTGEVMFEAANADTVLDSNVPVSYTVAIAEPASGGDAADGTVVVAPTGVTWDPATITKVTLSGGNLVATNNFVGSDAEQGAKVASASAKTTGKYYFEITFTNNAGSTYYDIGIGPPAQTYTNMSQNAGPGGNIIYFANNTIYTNGGSTGLTLGAMTNGTIIGMAVDLDNRKIWMRKAPSGNWNGQAIGSQNPVGTVGGVTIPAGSMVPFFGCSGANSGNSVTANFGATTFSGAVPSGFTSGWPP